MAKPITPKEMRAWIKKTWDICQQEAWQEQEPVAWLCRGVYSSTGRCPECQPLYTTPPKREWVGLTYGEVNECAGTDILKFYRAIEAKLKEKNT